MLGADFLGRFIMGDQGGHVYVLVSPKTELVKIGGTDFPPFKRIREINGSSPYRELGPWSLADFRQVNDWRKVEAFLHYAFRSCLDAEVSGAKELFRVAPQVVSSKLNEIEPDQIVNHRRSIECSKMRNCQHTSCASSRSRVFSTGSTFRAHGHLSCFRALVAGDISRSILARTRLHSARCRKPVRESRSTQS